MYDIETHKAQIQIRIGLDWITDEVFTHELPIVARLHGGVDKIRFRKMIDPESIEVVNDAAGAIVDHKVTVLEGEPWTLDAEDEMARLSDRWGRGGPDNIIDNPVDQIFVGGALALREFVSEGKHTQFLEELKARNKALAEQETGDDGAPIDVVEAKDMLRRLGLAKKQIPTHKRLGTLKAMVVLRVEDVLSEAGHRVPLMVTDAQIREATEKVPKQALAVAVATHPAPAQASAPAA